MQYRTLGSTSLSLSIIGLGCSRLGTLIGEKRLSDQLIGTAADSGINFFDTADSYGSGSSEVVLGRSLRLFRNRMIIASKIGYPVSPSAKLLSRGLSVFGYQRQYFAPQYLRAAVEKCLRRIGTDYLDLLQLHNPPPSLSGSEELWDTLKELRKAGKIRYFGVSAKDLGDAGAFTGVHGITSFQIPMNIFNFREASQVTDRLTKYSFGVIGRQAFISGALLKGEYGAEMDLTSEAQRDVVTLLRDSKLSPSEFSLKLFSKMAGLTSMLIGTLNPGHLKKNAETVSGSTVPPQIMQYLRL